MAEPVYIIDAKRTPVHHIQGAFSKLEPEQLTAPLYAHFQNQFGINKHVPADEVFMGNAVGPGGNLARLSLLEAGYDTSVPGVTVDRQCGSGLEAVHQGFRHLQAGAADTVLAGGVESASRAPKRSFFASDAYPVSSTQERARFSPKFIGDPDMGEAAETTAEAYGISRADQDAFAERSYRLAWEEAAKPDISREIIPVSTIQADASLRVPDKMNKLIRRAPAVFRESGTVTAANSSRISDGAALTLMATRSSCRQYGLKPVLELIDAVAAGVDPNMPGIGPVPAVERLLKQNRMSVEDISVWECNEAFASQVLASALQLGLPPERLNIAGGAIAQGHPYGASGAILVTRLLRLMQNSGLPFGVAMIGIGGGLGLASLYRLI
ncbi:acetyl-CoA C-acyltransferase [Marinococcus halophilus]|uniref:Acetoacetyl-CoA thiolase n=1 Tax=Marinococcus halophilus TaxID=1371 RepID=A0A510Y2T0_MARHA|nr:thiolase family protein [Marinococcus halophilus]OZT81660.1 acetyl-CoA C-acyltransferase [Marinococcus halophilus]GEK57609.1 acetyl-CoA acetyltransferase [Marinococcus halophilus]